MSNRVWRLAATVRSHSTISRGAEITGRRSNAVLVSEDDWRAVQETLHLLSIPGMGKLTLKLLRAPVRAYRERDLDLAVHTWRGDEELDVLKTALLREIVASMKDDPKTIDVGTHLMFIAKNLERVGDQATNICELVYYRVSGEHLPRRRGEGGNPR